MGGNLFCAGYAKQGTYKAGVIKIKFWLFNNPFIEIYMIWGKPKNNITRFKDSQPISGSVVADSAFTGQAVCIKKLSDPAGAQG